MQAGRAKDAVDTIIEQWNRERPELDVAPMAPIGRLKRCALLLEQRLEATFATFGICAWEFDVLATLRRSGAPYRLTPTALFSTLMITSGTMTHRLQRLEAAGLVQRVPNRDDARSMLVQLTQAGLELIERAVAAHVDNEHNILAPLEPAAREALEASLAALLAVLEAHKKGNAASVT